MGCKLLEIMADGLYAVFHRFEAFLEKKVDAQAVTVGWPSNGRRASSISALPAPAAQTSASGTACSLLPAAGLQDYEDTRLKTSSRVRMGLSLAWKASLAIRILYFLPCNRLHVNPSSLRCLYKPERMVLRRPITITIIPS